MADIHEQDTLPRQTKAKVLKGDFAEGERTLPPAPVIPDFARGERVVPIPPVTGDFATGEHELPVSTTVGDFASGEHTLPAVSDDQAALQPPPEAVVRRRDHQD